MKRFVLLTALLSTALLSPACLAAADPPAPGFLVAAPDRGFTGNEDIRDAYAQFAAGRNAELLFVTDARSEPVLRRALRALRERGADEVVALPLFLSAAEPRYSLLQEQLARVRAESEEFPPVQLAPEFGASYLAVEALAERLRAAPAGDGPARFLIVGQGARTAAQRQAIATDLARMAGYAAAEVPGTAFAVHVWTEVGPDDREAQQRAEAKALAARLHELPGARVVPFHLGRHLDRMMSFDSELHAALPPEAKLAEGQSLPPPLLAQWLGQTANRYLPLAGRQLGVVVHAHGADWHWNETLREAVRPLEDEYLVEYAFSMGDQATIERAVRRLETRGAQAVVVVRVFSLADSFRAGIERMLGMDIDEGRPAVAGSGHGDHGHGPSMPEPRIRAAIPMTTVGGLEDDPLFAKALLERAQRLSSDPARETVVLVGHGSGDDRADAHWNAMLDSLALQMSALGGDGFRAIRTGTWREDWPVQREGAIARLRGLVAEAGAGGGTTLVIPARTNGRGPEERFLAGLDYRLGEGFAPHPLFAEWIARQVEIGRDRLLRQQPIPDRSQSNAASTTAQNRVAAPGS